MFLFYRKLLPPSLPHPQGNITEKGILKSEKDTVSTPRGLGNLTKSNPERLPVNNTLVRIMFWRKWSERFG